MQTELPIIFEVSFEDATISTKIRNGLLSSEHFNNYRNLAKDIYELFDKYFDSFMVNHRLVTLPCKVHIEFDPKYKFERRKEFISHLAKTYNCNYCDKEKSTTTISAKQDVSVTFPYIFGAYNIDENKCISNCTIFIVIPIE